MARVQSSFATWALDRRQGRRPPGRGSAVSPSKRRSVLLGAIGEAVVTPIAEAASWVLDLLRPGQISEPGEAFDPRFVEIFLAAGWQPNRIDNKGQGHWTRPGKDPREGSSATEYPFPDSRVIIWSTSVPNTPTGVPLSPKRLGEALGVFAPPPARHLYVLERADSITLERPEWHWEGYLAKGVLQVVIGRQGDGKSTFASWVIGQRSRGAPFVDGGELTEPAVCLYLSLEESKGRIRARLQANGAALGNVVVMSSQLSDGRPWRLPAGAGILEEAIADNRVGLAVIDGLGYCVDGQQDYPTIATALSQLAQVAERTGATILGLTHPPKGQSDPVTAAIGSTAWTAVPRLTWLIGRDPDDQDQRVLRVGKTAYREPAAGIGFVVEDEALFDVGRIKMTGSSLVPGAALVAGMRDIREINLQVEVAKLLEEWTKDGPIAIEEARRRLYLEELRVSHKTLQRAARGAGLITSSPVSKAGPRFFVRGVHTWHTNETAGQGMTEDEAVSQVWSQFRDQT